MLRMKKLTLQNEREGHPTQKMNTWPRAKRKRKLGLTGLKAKRAVLQRRMSITASTKQRKKKSLAVAVEAEKRVEGQKAERRPISIKVVTEEGAQGAKKDIKKKKIRRQIRIKIKLKTRNLIRSIKKRVKKRIRRKQRQNQQARKDPAAETETKVKMKKQIRKGPEKEVGVRRGRNGEEEHPGRRTGGPEVQTGVRPETEAGAQEAEAVGETAAEKDLLKEMTEAGTLPTAGGDIAAAGAAAAAPTVIEQKKGRAEKVLILQKERNPETREARIVQKAEIEKIARKVGQALVPAPTATDHFAFN